MPSSNLSQTGQSAPSYAGDISPTEAWSRLAQDPAARLIDVRTQAEWNFVGVPDLTALSRPALFCEWQYFPGGQNPDFVAQAAAAAAQSGHAKGAPLFFLCRSGGRSRSAAIAMTANGYGPCFNIADGFEGSLDAERHRGMAGGWKAEGLPWIQT